MHPRYSTHYVLHFESGHYMIAGGVLGHAQALINPYLYGVRWRNALVRHAGLVGATKPDERALELASPVGI